MNRRAAVLAAAAAVLYGCGRKTAVPAATKPGARAAGRRSRSAPAQKPVLPRAEDKTEMPELQEIMPAEVRDRLLREVDESLRRTVSNLKQLGESSDSVSRRLRIEGFVYRAKSALAVNDLYAARRLAQRAEILSLDLLR